MKIAFVFICFFPIFSHANLEPCERIMVQNQLYIVVGSGINVREGPGIQFAKIGSLDKSVEVLEVCSQEGWSEIKTTHPALRNSHHGWVQSKFLKGHKNSGA